MTKIKLCTFILILASIKVFSQGNMDLYVNLVPYKEYTTTIPLKEAILPATLFWDSNIGQIRVTFMGDGSDELFIYAFPKKQSFSKLMKEKKDLWFDKGIKKYMKGKNVEKSIDDLVLENIISDAGNNVVKTLEFRDPESQLNFSFMIERDNCKIPFTLYVASREFLNAKSPRNKKIEYPTKFTFNILLQEICDGAELLRVIEYLDNETEKLLAQKDVVAAGLDSLYNLSCAKIKELKSKNPGKEEKFTGTKDQTYNECPNLKESIKTYNDALDERNNAILVYNSVLVEKKQKCPGSESVTRTSSSDNCKGLYQINEKLTELLLDSKNCKQSDIPILKQKYDKIKNGVTSDHKNCSKEYNTFLDLCNRINKRLK